MPLVAQRTRKYILAKLVKNLYFVNANFGNNYEIVQPLSCRTILRECSEPLESWYVGLSELLFLAVCSFGGRGVTLSDH